MLHCNALAAGLKSCANKTKEESMKKVGFTLEKEDIEDQVKAGRYNPALVIVFDYGCWRHEHTIGAGYSDEVCLFKEKDDFYVLSMNRSLEYMCMEKLPHKKVEEERPFMKGNDIIYWDSNDIKEIFGKRRNPFSYSGMFIAKVFLSYWGEYYAE